jgi:hypothetical protein
MMLFAVIGLNGCTSGSQRISGGPERSRPECASFNPGPPYASPAVRLAPLLLTDDDLPNLPNGWGSSPSAIIGVLGEFNAAVPKVLPYNSVDFYYTGSPSSYHEVVYFGLGVSEMLGQAASPSAAERMAKSLKSVNGRCHPGMPIELLGTMPHVIASVSSGQTFSSAIAYVAKGPYLVQLTWADSLQQPMGPLAPLPSSTEMTSIANAALAHLPP